LTQSKVNITSPVGRMVMGNLYDPNTKDFDGKPLTIKTGANAGQPRVSYFVGLAIPKGAEQHWSQTEWGAKIWAVGHTAFPQAAQRPDFAWKIEDGDSQIPNKRNRKPCDNEGWARHWILKLSGGFAPKVYRQEGSGYVQVLDKDYVKPGYYVEVAFNVDSNGQQNNPGVYLNHSMVCFRAFGPEIVFGPNVEEAGFGKAPLPAGASMTPPPSGLPMPAAAPALPPFAGPPAPLAPPAPILVVPQPGFVQMPPPPPLVPGVSVAMPTAGVIPAPPAPASPSSGPTYQMTGKAGGASREACLAGGWTDAQLIAQGMMTLG
jgi:hypothetical protein